jgi:hypothetical protein
MRPQHATPLAGRGNALTAQFRSCASASSDRGEVVAAFTAVNVQAPNDAYKGMASMSGAPAKSAVQSEAAPARKASERGQSSPFGFSSSADCGEAPQSPCFLAKPRSSS